MKAIKIIIGSILLIGAVSAMINGFSKENSGAGMFGFLIGTGLFALIGILLINSGLKSK